MKRMDTGLGAIDKEEGTSMKMPSGLESVTHDI